MAESKRDIWAEWMLDRRFGGDREEMATTLTNHLYPVRDKLLSRADLSGDETLLDVGCGDGLIAFGALEKVQTGKIIFSDISEDLLNHVRFLANENVIKGGDHGNTDYYHSCQP